MIGFLDLRTRLLNRLRALVSGGHWTERALAREAGISQPHLHHVLKGVREMSPAMADRLLASAKLSIVDLLRPDEVPAFTPLGEPLGGEPRGRPPAPAEPSRSN